VEIVGNTGAIAESTSRGSLTKLHWCWQSSEKGSYNRTPQRLFSVTVQQNHL